MADKLQVATVVIAAVALAQPWLYVAYRKFFRRGLIETHLTSNLDIGFTNFGPMITVGGTFRAVNRDIFISSIGLEVTREKDSSKHEFHWIGFFPRAIPLTPTAAEQSSFEVASGFMVLQNDPRRFNILFADSSTKEEMDSPLAKAYEALLSSKQGLGIDNLGGCLRYEPNKAMELLTKIGNEYRKHPDYVSAYSDLTKICYWQAGAYQLSMDVSTARPNHRFTTRCRFELSADDEKRLGTFNPLNMLELPLNTEIGQPGRPFLRAFPKVKANA
jgi:hypothetical protein